MPLIFCLVFAFFFSFALIYFIGHTTYLFFFFLSTCVVPCRVQSGAHVGEQAEKAGHIGLGAETEGCIDKGLGVKAFKAGIICFESSSQNNLKLAISMMELPRSDSRSGREVASRLTGSIFWRTSNLLKSWL